MNIRFHGHSTLEVQLEGTNILVDPWLTGNPKAVVDASDLKPDVILVTHAHFDHWTDVPQIAKACDALVVANFDIAEYLKREHSYANVLGLNTGGQSAFDWGSVKVTHALHSSSFPDGAYGGNPNGFLLMAEGKTVYLMGDTAPFTEMQWIGEDHTIDLAFMPIGDCFTMGPRDAIRAAKMVKPKLTVPIHFGTFPPIEVDTSAWSADMRAAGFETRVLAPGDSVSL